MSIKAIKRKSQIFLVLILFCIIFKINACEISGKQIGVCQSRQILTQESFCYQYIRNYVCVPQNRVTWNSYDAKYRDQLIEEILMKNLQIKFVAQYNDPWTTNIVSNNLQCYYAYRKFICSWNFPQCDMNLLKTKPPCKSYCISFLSNCAASTEICDVLYQNKDIGLDINC